MKQYILKLSFAIFCMFSLIAINAQEQTDSTKTALIDLPFGKVSEDRLVGAVDVITSEDISHSSLPYVNNAIQGLTSGYVNGLIRGRSRGGDNNNNQPLVIIDGIANRLMVSLAIEEVESVHILKDVTAKMLYGSRAANGVIVVKTKRGINAKKRITFTGEYGYNMVDQYPEYLGSADYMRYNNQALKNDGRDPSYSQQQIDDAGINYKNPDEDWYGRFAEDFSSYKRANMDLIGGDEKVKYFLNLGWLGTQGLEKVGDKRTDNALNVRSNLDYEVNDVISVNLDIAGQFRINQGNRVDNLMGELSKRKPNDYPVFISPVAHIDSMGTSDVDPGKNLYGEMVYAGYKRTETSFAQTNIGMDFDLNKYVDGLSARAYVSFDINNQITEGKELTYRTLKPSTDSDELEVFGVNNPKANEKKISDAYYRNLGAGGNIDYNKVFGEHALSATLSYMMDNKSVKTVANSDNLEDNEIMATIQDDKTMNFGFRLNYAFNNKYIAEYSGSYMGSTRFVKDNRWGLYNAFGVSYILSEEDFMDNVGFIDYLKLKASFGTIGYDQGFDYLLYDDFYNPWGGSFKTGDKDGNNSLKGTRYIQAGNKNLTFEESKEMNIGMTMRMLKNKLELNAEYFTEERTGMPTEMKAAYPGVIGVPTIVANYNAVDTKGFEVALQFSDKVGDLSYSVGGTLTHSKSTWTQYDEANDFSFQNKEGTEVDAIWGYLSDGFYMNADEVANYGYDDETLTPLSSLNGTFIPGDLKIKDLTDTRDEYTLEDNVIDKYDQTIIGNSTPRYAYTLNLNLQYKNFGLFALGQGYTGSDWMANSLTYITNKGNVTYSKFVRDAAVPVFDGNGTAIGVENDNFSSPRLSSNGQAHSYVASDYWKRNSAYFRLRTLEVTYMLPKTVVSKISAQSLQLFARGNNLFTISSMDEVSPAAPWAGITYNPEMITITGGLRLSF